MTSPAAPSTAPAPAASTPAAPTHPTTLNTTDFPFSPPLPSRYTIRPLQASDRTACARLLCHAFMYHNPIDVVYGLPSSSYELPFHLMWEHCWPDQLSFVILDQQHKPTHTDNSTAAAAVVDERQVHWPVSEHDHEADAATLDDSNIVGVILNNDGSRQLAWPRDDPSFKAAMAWSDDWLLWTQLYGQCDLRVNPSHPLHHLYEPVTTPAAPPHYRRGEHVHCFLLATHCHHHRHHLATYLTTALYYHAQRLGYESMHVEASHPATAHLFQSGVMSNGVVTHRLAPSSVVKRVEGGEEQRRWSTLTDDVVAVYVKIDQSLTFTLLPYSLTVLKLPATADLPHWSTDPSIDFISITRTRHELSIIAPTSVVPVDSMDSSTSGNSGGSGAQQSEWRALAVHGPLAFGLVGVLYRVLRVLAGQRISVLAVSTYETDVVLVSEEQVNEAVRVLQGDGHRMCFEPVVARTGKAAASEQNGERQTASTSSSENEMQQLRRAQRIGGQSSVT